MTYLVTISIGPVQEFIAAARRTADLRAGSQLLQRLAAHIASQIAEAGGTLIFPATPDTPGPNKVVARFEGNPAQLAQELREGAVQWLWERWKLARKRFDQVPIDEHLAEEQVKNFLEFYAAWVPLEEDYPRAYRQVELLLAGRKALRDFRQVPPRPGRPKSPLDPSRDGVIELDGGWQLPQQAFDQPLYLKRTEYLDAVSLLKRVQGAVGEQKVPSTSLMAAQSVLPIARQRSPQAVQRLESIADNAPGPVDIGDLMFPHRVQEEIEAQGTPLSEYLRRHLAEIERWRQQVLRSISPQLHECPPYYAILAADGDRMGLLLRAQQSVEAHQQLSRALADFAQQAAHIVENLHGYLVYAGGDDLLAFLPVNMVLSCAKQLTGQFHRAMQPFTRGVREGGTLSVGVAIVHRMEMLQQSLDWAREAEKAAKRQRNALAIALHTRGGVPVTVVTSCASDRAWDGWYDWIRAFRAGLTRGFPYELQRLAREAENADLRIDNIRDEARRIFDRKQGTEARGGAKAFRPILERELEAVHHVEQLRRFAEQLIIARFLAEYPNGEVRA
jgi:CRISPR-associated protein Cmr2